MAHPKRKRQKLEETKEELTISTASGRCLFKTGESHLYHRAYWHEGKLYYRGKVLLDNAAETEA